MKILAAIQIILLLAATFIPEGRFVMSEDEDTASACCCSAAQQKDGGCCCSKKHELQHKSSGSCCASKSAKAKSADRTVSRRKREKLPLCGVISTCPCGSESDVAVVVHLPRTPAKRVVVQPMHCSAQNVCAIDAMHEADLLPPETPPPESSIG